MSLQANLWKHNKRPERKTTDCERRVTKEKRISSEGDGEATIYETNTQINFASGSVTALTARQESLVQVCFLMITALKLLAQVPQQYLNKAQQGNMLYHQDDT